MGVEVATGIAKVAKDGVVTFAEWSRSMIGHLGKEITPYLQKTWESIGEGKVTEKEAVPSVEAPYVAPPSEKAAEPDDSVEETTAITTAALDEPMQKLGHVMNWIQRWTLILGLLVMVAIAAYPPATFVYHTDGANIYLSDRMWIWSSKGMMIYARRVREGDGSKHQGYLRIDYDQLKLECFAVAALTGAVWLAARSKKRPRRDEHKAAATERAKETQ